MPSSVTISLPFLTVRKKLPLSLATATLRPHREEVEHCDNDDDIDEQDDDIHDGDPPPSRAPAQAGQDT